MESRCFLLHKINGIIIQENLTPLVVSSLCLGWSLLLLLLSKFGNSIKYKTMIYELGKSEVRKSFIDLKIDTRLTLTAADPKPRMLLMLPPKCWFLKGILPYCLLQWSINFFILPFLTDTHIFENWSNIWNFKFSVFNDYSYSL